MSLRPTYRTDRLRVRIWDLLCAALTFPCIIVPGCRLHQENWKHSPEGRAHSNKGWERHWYRNDVANVGSSPLVCGVNVKRCLSCKVVKHFSAVWPAGWSMKKGIWGQHGPGLLMGGVQKSLSISYGAMMGLYKTQTVGGRRRRRRGLLHEHKRKWMIWLRMTRGEKDDE